MGSTVDVERDGHVAILHLENAPEGVMDAGLARALSSALEGLKRASRPRVVMLTGTVRGVFVRRYDVAELLPSSRSGDADTLEALPRLIRQLEQMEAITVAALNGTALGGGFELALGCDFRLACEGPFRFGLRETEVGLVPGAGGTQRLVRLLGTARTLELVLLGRLLKPQEALALGLLSHVFEAESFAAGSRRFCQELAQRAPVALALAKQVIRQGAELALDDALHLERCAFEVSARTLDAQGAVAAYARGERYPFQGE